MKSLDIILLIPLLFGAYLGYKKGLLLEIISLFAFFLAIVGAFKLADYGQELLGPYFQNWEKALPIISFLLLFVSILLLVNMVGKVAKKIIDLTLLGGIDNFAGAVLGLLKWAFGLSLILWLASSVDIEFPLEMTDDSYLYPTIASFAPFIFEGVSEYMPFIQEMYETLKEKFTTNSF